MGEYEERMAEKEKERAAAARRAGVRKLLGYGKLMAGAAVVVLLGYWMIQSQSPQKEDLSQAFEIQGQEHIAIGADHPEYNSNPPTSGWHYAQPARNGQFYPTQLPDEQLIHNLEHGEIWISYHPGVSQEVKDRLRKFTGTFVLVAPRAENDTHIALASWGRLDKFDLENGELDEQRIRDFILRYSNRGPEKVHTPGTIGQ